MVEQRVVIASGNGLHARPAAKFVQAAKGFSSKVRIATEAKEVDAKSILGVISLGAGLGTEVAIRADGPDASAAVAELARLLEGGLGE